MSLPRSLGDATAIATPCVLAGILHIVVIRRGALRLLSNCPIDFNVKIQGKRIFGDHKTFRGLAVMVLGTAFSSILLFPALFALVGDTFLAGNATHLRCFLWGGLLGLGCVLGELPNSFMKRQIAIAPGQSPAGAMRHLCWIIDQLDSVVGAIVFSALIWPLPLLSVVCSILLGLSIHALGDVVMIHLGLKRQRPTL